MYLVGGTTWLIRFIAAIAVMSIFLFILLFVYFSDGVCDDWSLYPDTNNDMGKYLCLG